MLRSKEIFELEAYPIYAHKAKFLGFSPSPNLLVFRMDGLESWHVETRAKIGLGNLGKKRPSHRHTSRIISGLNLICYSVLLAIDPCFYDTKGLTLPRLLLLVSLPIRA